MELSRKFVTQKRGGTSQYIDLSVEITEAKKRLEP